MKLFESITSISNNSESIFLARVILVRKMERIHGWWCSVKFVSREIKYMFLYCYNYRLPRKYGRQVSLFCKLLCAYQLDLFMLS